VIGRIISEGKSSEFRRDLEEFYRAVGNAGHAALIIDLKGVVNEHGIALLWCSFRIDQYEFT